MIGQILFAIYMIYDKWLWKVFIILGFYYCFWIFVTAIDAHLKCQMSLWSQNLGM